MHNLVKRNRNCVRDEDLPQLAGYVLEELAAICYFAKRNIIKVGTEKEKHFDDLAIKYPVIPKLNKELFDYNSNPENT